MGLDMYLYAKEYFADYDWYSDERRDVYRTVIDKTSASQLQDEESPFVIVQYNAMYWRKANHIHKWFVDVVQDGNDNCGSYSVHPKQLEDLLDTCKRALENPKVAPEILPTYNGFFFGGTEYDDWYFASTMRTVERLPKIIETVAASEGNISLHYQSSW